MLCSNLLTKRLFTIALIMMLTPTVSRSLDNPKSLIDVYLGMSYNLKSESLKVDYYNDPNWRTEEGKGIYLLLGFTYQYFFQEKTAFRLGANIRLLENSYKIYTGYNSDESADINLSSTSIIFPATIRYENEIYIGAGMYAGINAQTSWRDSSSSGGKGDFSDTQYNQFDYGLTFELGFIINDKVQIGLRYDHGFINIIDTNWEKTKNRILYFTYGIRLITS